MKKTIIAAAMLVAVGVAQADTISFAYGLPLVEHTTEITETGLLGKFDSTLGTLTGATLNIFGAGTTNISLTNNAATNVNGRATASVDLMWSSALGALDALLVDDLALSFSTGAALLYTPGQTRSFGPLHDEATFSYNLSSILGSFAAAGGGDFAITCESLSGINVLGGGGNLASNQTTTAGCGANITYTYDAAVVNPNPVPEPASLALIAVGLLGAGVARRRKAA